MCDFMRIWNRTIALLSTPNPLKGANDIVALRLAPCPLKGVLKSKPFIGGWGWTNSIYTPFRGKGVAWN